MRVLVTGGCGFVGSAVVRYAAERGDQILNLDRRRKANPVHSLASVAGRDGYARIEADISDRSLMRAVFREFKPDAVIHLAGGAEEDAARLFDSEVSGAFAILEASRAHYEKLSVEDRARFRFVHAIRAEADDPGTPTPVEAARFTAGALIDSWSRAYGMPVVTCVAGEVFGPYQADTAFLPRLIASILSGRPFVLPNGGETVRDWLPVRDFAVGLVRAAEAAPPQTRFDFSVGAERRDIDVADALCVMLDARSPLPGGAFWGSMVSVEGDGSRASPGPMLDAMEAEHDLGWRAAGFHSGLDRMLAWAIGRYALQQAATPIHAVAAE